MHQKKTALLQVEILFLYIQVKDKNIRKFTQAREKFSLKYIKDFVFYWQKKIIINGEERDVVVAAVTISITVQSTIRKKKLKSLCLT